MISKFAEVFPLRRPLLVVVPVFCAGIMLAERLPVPAALWWTGLLAVVITFWSMHLMHPVRGKAGPTQWAAVLLTAAGCLAAGGLWFRVWDDAVTAGLRPFAGKNVTLEGVIASEVAPYSGGSRAVLAADRVYLDGREYPAQGRILLLVRGDRAAKESSWGYGDRVRLRGRLTPPGPPRNPGEFDYRAYLRHRGIGFTMAVAGYGRGEALERLGRGHGSRAMALALAAKRRFAAVFDGSLPAGQAGLLKALIFGDKGALDADDAAAFRTAGLSHVLAVSGLHVGFVAGALTALARFLHIGRSAEALLVLPALGLYVLMTGAAPPAMRAGLMFASVTLARAAGRKGDGLNFLALVLLILLFHRPAALFDAGLQLSFAAVLGILALAPVMGGDLSRKPRWRRWLVSAFAVSLGANLATLPLVLAHFGSASPAGPLAGLIAVPLAGFAVPAGLAFSVSGLFAGHLPEPAALPLRCLLGLLQSAAGWFAAMPGASVGLPRPGSVQIAAYALALCYAFRLWPFSALRSLSSPSPSLAGAPADRLRRVLVGLLGLAALVVPLRLDRPWPVEAVFLDVGQGDGMVFRLPGWRIMVVDGGPAPRGTGRAGAVADYLRYLGVRRVDILVLSHFDADHVAGALPVLRDFAVGEIWESRAPSDETDIVRQVRAAVAAEGASVWRPQRGEMRTIAPGVVAEVLNPPARLLAGTPADENNNSLVLRIRYGRTSFLLTGDLEREGEQDVLASAADVRSTVLKVGHHAGGTTTSQPFVDEVAPRVAIVQVGRNSYGMPADRPLQRLREAGAAVWRTDRSGAVTVRTDGRRVEVKGMLGEEVAMAVE